MIRRVCFLYVCMLLEISAYGQLLFERRLTMNVSGVTTNLVGKEGGRTQCFIPNAMRTHPNEVVKG